MAAAICRDVINSDVGVVFGFKCKCLGMKKDGRMYSAILNVAGWMPGASVLSGAYRVATSVYAYVTRNSEESEANKAFIGGNSLTFLITNGLRGIAEILQMGVFLFAIDVIVSIARWAVKAPTIQGGYVYRQGQQ